MPFYEYECSSCKFYVETLQKITDDPLKQCPSCKKQTLKKLISAPVFRLKGSGWYETDFKSEGEDKRNLADRDEPAEKSEDSKPAAASDAKADKPEKKAESKPEVKTGAAKKPAAKAAPAKGKKPAAKAPARRPAPKKAASAKKKAKRR